MHRTFRAWLEHNGFSRDDDGPRERWRRGDTVALFRRHGVRIDSPDGYIIGSQKCLLHIFNKLSAIAENLTSTQ